MVLEIPQKRKTELPWYTFPVLGLEERHAYPCSQQRDSQQQERETQGPIRRQVQVCCTRSTEHHHLAGGEEILTPPMTHTREHWDVLSEISQPQKGQIPYESTYTRSPGSSNPQRQKVDGGGTETWGGEGESLFKRDSFHFTRWQSSRGGLHKMNVLNPTELYIKNG